MDRSTLTLHGVCHLNEAVVPDHGRAATVDHDGTIVKNATHEPPAGITHAAHPRSLDRHPEVLHHALNLTKIAGATPVVHRAPPVVKGLGNAPYACVTEMP